MGVGFGGSIFYRPEPPLRIQDATYNPSDAYLIKIRQSVLRLTHAVLFALGFLDYPISHSE